MKKYLFETEESKNLTKKQQEEAKKLADKIRAAAEELLKESM